MKANSIEEVLKRAYYRGLDRTGYSIYEMKSDLATIEQLVLERVKAQEYPDDVVLWTPDGNERTRVIKTEDAVAALKQLMGGKEDGSTSL